MYDVGSVVAGHQLVAPLGSGPFGRVFRAEGPHGPVAVKLLKPGFLGRPDGMAAFGRLGASVAVHSQLRHPYLARTYDVIEDRGPSAFGQVTEVLEGQTLAEVQVEDTSLKGQDPLGLAGVLTWYEQLGDVLAWLHAQSMVHGNLKPTNVMRISLAGEHHVKLLDVSWSSIGVAAVPAGPTSYVAPEQYQGSIPTPRSDQWALATMLERTFTRGHHRLALGVLPAALVQAVQRATQDEPEARFPVLNEFVETIREIRVELQRTGGADVAPQHDAKTLPAGSVPSDLAGGRPGSGGPTTDLDAIPEPVVVDPSQDTGLSRGTAPGMQMPSVSVDGRVTRPADAEIKSSRIGESTVEGMMPLRRHDISGLLEEESGMIPEVSVPSGRSIPPPASTVRGFAPASHRMPRPPTVADPGSTV
ncbi:MAG: protein kinase, partial [Myxococcota bacterium]